MQIKETLDNLNINSFFVDIEKIQNVNYKLKSIETPDISIGEVPVGTPFQNMNIAGDHIEYGKFVMTFIVDENLYNYGSILNWVRGLGFPESFDDFKSLISNETEISKRSYSAKETSDISVHLLTNHRNSNRVMRIINAFPISLSGISLGNDNTESEVITATATFSCTGINMLV